MKWQILTLSLAIILTHVSCFSSGISKKGSIQGYQNGIVYTYGEKRFYVGELPDDWKRENIHLKNVFLIHQEYPTSISISSFCEDNFDDGSLEILSNQLLYGIKEVKVLEEKKIQVSSEKALLRKVSGSMDDVSIKVDTVVFKMDRCVFDLVLTSTPQYYQIGEKYFYSLIKNFKPIH